MHFVPKVYAAETRKSASPQCRFRYQLLCPILQNIKTKTNLIYLLEGNFPQVLSLSNTAIQRKVFAAITFFGTLYLAWKLSWIRGVKGGSQGAYRNS